MLGPKLEINRVLHFTSVAEVLLISSAILFIMTQEFRERFVEHTRTSGYLRVGDFIEINDPAGNVAFMKIAFAEVMGQFPILFADEFDNIAAKGARAAAGAAPNNPTPSGPFVAMDFLTPNREDRLIQVRPTIVALYRENIVAGQLVAPTPEMVDVLIQWVSPLNSQRGGTDIESIVRLGINTGNSGIPQNVGGTLNGFMNALDIYTRDDPNENYDLFILSGMEPGYRILNNSPTFPIGGGLTPNENLDFDWYICFQGYRYVMEPVTREEYDALKRKDIIPRSIGVGGVPNVSTIRGG